MYAQAATAPEFKSWLISTLEPMCDADPVVMSDYIVALLEHDAVMSEDQWKEFVARELLDFLDDQARPFVNTLFETLKTRSYLASSSELSAPSTEPAPTEQSTSAIVSSYRPPAPRVPPTGPAADQAGPSRAPQQPVIKQDEDMVDDSNAGQASGSRQHPPREKCWDYHNKGFCMRGADCPYEHSDDVIIPSAEMMFGPMPFIPPGPPMDGGFGRGGGRGGRGGGRGGRGRGRGGMNGHGPPGPPGPPGMMAPPFPFMPFPMQFPAPMSQSGNERQPNFWGINKPPEDRNGTTLVITDIPRGSLSVPAIKDYFARFGDVTNVAVDGGSARALVSFTSNQEAYQAWKSPDSVFGNRHVKVLWHRPRPGQGEAGKQALEKSADLVARLKALENGPTSQEKKAILSGPQSRLTATLVELESKERRGQKETLMAEQKVLLNKAKVGTKEEKVAILGRLKEITKEIENLDKPVETNGVHDQDVEMGDQEKLDQELARHGMETKAQGDQAELMKLNAQLTALREKATTLGIPASSAARYSPYSTHARRGRGGRGRGGAAIRGPMRLDNRSRVILLSGDGAQSDPIRQHFESTGGVLEATNGGVKVGYPNREMAEKALAQGTKEIPNFSGNLNATWFIETTSSSEKGMSSSQEIEMVEESQRGDRDDDE